MKEVRIVRVYLLDLKTFKDHLKETGLWDKGVYTVADLWYYVGKDLNKLDEHLKPFCAAYYNKDRGEKKEYGTIFTGGDNGYELAVFVRNEGDEPTTYCYRVERDDKELARGCRTTPLEVGKVTWACDEARKIPGYVYDTYKFEIAVSHPNVDEVELWVKVRPYTTVTNVDISITKAECYARDVRVEFTIKNNTGTEGVVFLKFELEGYKPWVSSYPLGRYETKTVEKVIPIDPTVIPTNICITPLREDGTEIPEKKVCSRIEVKLPNLRITKLDYPSSAKPGESITISWEVYNQGYNETFPQWIRLIDLDTGAELRRTNFRLDHTGVATGSWTLTMPNRDWRLRAEAGYGETAAPARALIVTLPPTPELLERWLPVAAVLGATAIFSYALTQR